MFLTTVRIRRARKTNLDALLTDEQRKDRQNRDLVEVMAHSFVVAIIDVANARAEDGTDAVLWAHASVAEDPQSVLQAVRGAVALMQAAEAGGLTRTPAAA